MTDAKKEDVKQSSASKRPVKRRASKARVADASKQAGEPSVLQPENMKIYPKGYGQGKKGGRYGGYDHGTKGQVLYNKNVLRQLPTSFRDEVGREYTVDTEGKRRYLVEEPHTIQDVKNNLVFLRLKKGFSQAGFSRALGVSQPLLCLWEKASSSAFCTFEYVGKLAELLETNPKYIDRTGLRYITIADEGAHASEKDSTSYIVRLYHPPVSVPEVKQNLCYYRLKAGMGLKEAAMAAHVDSHTFELWENTMSKEMFPDPLIYGLAVILHCPVEDLNEYGITDKDEPVNIPLCEPAALKPSPETLRDLKNNLRYYRERGGLSLREAAYKFSITAQQYCAWENLNNNEFFPESLLQKVASEFKAPLKHLSIILGSTIFIREPQFSSAAKPESAAFTDEPTAMDTGVKAGANWADDLLGIDQAPYSGAPRSLDPSRPNATALSRLEPICNASGSGSSAKAKEQTDIFKLTGWAPLCDHYACARVEGNSMQLADGSGIISGDVVIINLAERDPSLLDGRIVCVAFADGSLWVRRLKRENSGFRLICDNPAYSGHQLSLGTNGSIVGRVMTTLHAIF